MHGYSSVPCSSSSTQSLWCLFSTTLCRRWWNSCLTSCASLTRFCLFPSRLSKCPRLCLMASLCAPLCATRSWWNSWWKCRLSFPILPCGGLWSSKLTFQFLVVVGEVLVFKVFFPERVQQRRPRPPRNAFLSGLWSRSFVFLGEGLQDSRPGQVSPASSSFQSPAGSDDDANEPGDGVFRTFPQGKKVRSAGQVSADLPRHISSWTPAAYVSSPGGPMSRMWRKRRRRRSTRGA